MSTSTSVMLKRIRRAYASSFPDHAYADGHLRNVLDHLLASLTTAARV
jgi:hypothetical protein